MNITDVAWVRDQRGRPALQLRLDGHPAHVRSGQKAALLDRGIVDGIVYFASERSTRLADAFVRDDYGPDLSAIDLIGCTDDPEVFALYGEMCRAILAGTWRPGPRPRQPGPGPSSRQIRAPRSSSGRPGYPPREEEDGHADGPHL